MADKSFTGDDISPSAQATEALSLERMELEEILRIKDERQRRNCRGGA